MSSILATRSPYQTPRRAAPDCDTEATDPREHALASIAPDHTHGYSSHASHGSAPHSKMLITAPESRPAARGDSLPSRSGRAPAPPIHSSAANSHPPHPTPDPAPPTAPQVPPQPRPRSLDRPAKRETRNTPPAAPTRQSTNNSPDPPNHRPYPKDPPIPNAPALSRPYQIAPPASVRSALGTPPPSQKSASANFHPSSKPPIPEENAR